VTALRTTQQVALWKRLLKSRRFSVEKSKRKECDGRNSLLRLESRIHSPASSFLSLVGGDRKV
jgi:hypothetical protein